MDLYGFILEFWFGPTADKNLWFQSDLNKRNQIDKLIYNNFGSIIDSINNISIKLIIANWTNNDIISAIICLDQFSRHIYRNKKDMVFKNTKSAILLTNYLYDSGIIYNDEFMRYIPFILMPYKHDNIFTNFGKIYKVINHFVNFSNKENNSFIWKFYLDSLKKYLLHDKQTNNIYISNTISDDISKNDINSVCEYYSECSPNIVLNPKNLLYQTINKFLKKYKHPINNRLLVSLSGGPDSMVLVYLLKYLSKQFNITVDAFHINYGNRLESDLEQEMVSEFCSKNDISLYIYKYPYIRRSNCPREFYENITRIVRFNLYKYFKCPVILGHIKDDLVENIWTNIAKGRDLFKLHKIDEVDTIHGVDILRPFHRIDKKDIYLFAKKYHIPYLKNTTPVWSNRGKIRNEFLPAVNKQFGKETDNKILFLSDSLVSYHKLINKMVFLPLLSSVVYKQFGLEIDISKFLDMDTHFWQYILTELFHSMGESMPSIGSVQNFVKIISKGHVGMMTLKNNYYCYLDTSKNLYILKSKMIQERIGKPVLKKSDWISIKNLLNHF